MKRVLGVAIFTLSLPLMSGCRKDNGNHYKVYFKTLRENTQPAQGFSVDAWVKGKSERETKVTGSDGMANFDDLPTPDSKHQLNTVLHYFVHGKDESREIAYPFITSDAERLKDTQYIPNGATYSPQ